MGSVPQNRPATALLSKGSTGNPRTKAAAESAVRPAKDARWKSARQANRSPPRGSASPEIHTPKRRQRARFVQRKKPAGKPRAELVGVRPRHRFAGNPRAKAAAESAVRPAEEARREAARRVSRSSPAASFRRKSACQSGGGERGSSSGRSPPEVRTPSQPEFAPRQCFAGNLRAKAAAEQRVQYFESGQARLIQRKKLIGKPRAALWAVLRRGKAILCSVES